MEQDDERDWPARLAEHIGERVAHFRGTTSAQELADRCAELGHPIARSVIAKLERGHRRTVTVADVIILGRALRVPPLLLIFPLGSRELFEVTPDTEIATWTAAQWFIGEEPWQTRRMSDGRWTTTSDGFTAWQDGPARTIERWREHDTVLEAWRKSQRRREGAVKAAGVAGSADERDAHVADAEMQETVAERREQELRALRREMRRAGLVPDKLPADLARVDREDGSDDPA